MWQPIDGPFVSKHSFSNRTHAEEELNQTVHFNLHDIVTGSVISFGPFMKSKNRGLYLMIRGNGSKLFAPAAATAYQSVLSDECFLTGDEAGIDSVNELIDSSKFDNSTETCSAEKIRSYAKHLFALKNTGGAINLEELAYMLWRECVEQEKEKGAYFVINTTEELVDRAATLAKLDLDQIDLSSGAVKLYNLEMFDEKMFEAKNKTRRTYQTKFKYKTESSTILYKKKDVNRKIGDREVFFGLIIKFMPELLVCLCVAFVVFCFFCVRFDFIFKRKVLIK
jgi:hypothetical protein